MIHPLLQPYTQSSPIMSANAASWLVAEREVTASQKCVRTFRNACSSTPTAAGVRESSKVIQDGVGGLTVYEDPFFSMRDQLAALRRVMPCLRCISSENVPQRAV
jgi:hypothetical protein